MRLNARRGWSFGLLLAGVQNVVYGKVEQTGRSKLIGSPPPAVAAELEKLWKTTFRSQPK